MNSEFDSRLQYIEDLKNDIKLGTEAAIKHYEKAIKDEISRIGRLKTTEVTVEENEWYLKAKTGAFYYWNSGFGNRIS